MPTATPQDPPAPPDVVVIMTDQQVVGCTAASGGPDTMPRTDALLAGGTRFTRARTSSPLCVPARESLLTGRFPSAHRVRQNSTARHALYGTDLLDVLRGCGYSLHFSGKPHMHPGPSDFDSFTGPFLHDHGPGAAVDGFAAWLRAMDHGVAHAPTPFPVEDQFPHRIVDGALASLEAAPEDAPRFLWVSFPEPHNPYQVPEPYFSMFEDEVPPRATDTSVLDGMDWRFRWLHRLFEEKRPGFDDDWRRYRANYLGMLRLIDDQIGRVLDAIAAAGRDTIVVVLADHGDFLGEYGLQRKGAAMPDALMRIPLGFAGPGIAAAEREELVSIVDVLPTLAELLTGQIPAGVQGRSLLPLLRGEPAPQEEFGSILGELGFGGVSYDEDARPPLHFPYEGRSLDELNSVTMGGEMRMLVRGHHKLVVDDRGRDTLHDLEADPLEIHDLSGDPDRQGLRAELHRELVRWMMRVADDLPEGDYVPRTRPHHWRWA
ncbi:sulfatase-like hydrolase/transferase [Brachybacterium sp. NBEC-018]|uniref:sulfatase-like hydrolase/transferase n=1 Tax=Brachybacterium sp. NBEC-018 TaxID=2996004 RepID=UPI002174FD7A|nr:sulfatase-like hydrolase/transferase [Brachybacterium sp. NBEC-018]UVY84816.1 sulfatase-like hydrolase/transferase [Brachybacterium sp. NBEC-018]